ncbi:hypothetical protein [Rugosimonospora africana]|nr:hypothetical protein [Rugosimonospora africana]
MPTMRDPDVDIESQLVDCVLSGELLDLAGAETVDESAMRSWDDSRTVQANLIREILRGRRATSADPRGLRLRGARIAGRLDLENLTAAVALELQDCFLPDGIIARDAALPGLALDGCLIEHPAEPPLAADRLRSAAGVSLVGSVVIAAATAGAVRLAAAHIGGQLDCSAARIRNRLGPALNADSVHVDQSVFLRRGFDAAGAGETGTVNLSGAQIGGQLDCSGAQIQNQSGPALNGDCLQVEHGMYLHNGFEAVGTGGGGAVRLLGAHIGVQLTCRGAKIRNGSGPALAADRAHIDGSVNVGDGFEANGAGQYGAVRLPGVQIGGRLGLSLNGVQNESDPQSRLLLDGLTYGGVPIGPSIDDLLGLLRHGTPVYAAQPYQQLAAGHRAAGHDRDVRRILMEQRRHQIQAKTTTGKGARAWARLTGLTLGYGYQPWRALIGLLAVLITAVALCVLAGDGLTHTRNSTTSGTACTSVERVGVGLDLGLPLIKTDARTQCDLTATAAGQWLTVAGWVLQLLAWGFATLFIAGFTGAVRKT